MPAKEVRFTQAMISPGLVEPTLRDLYLVNFQISQVHV